MKIAILVLTLAALAGCAVYVPEPDALMAGGDLERLPDLRAGRALYLSKCSGCHSLIPVDRYDARRWESEVDEMFRLKKVRMSADERGGLLRYLSAASDPGLRPR
jgi:mono/diheme cytochrome c family protein